MAIIIGRRNFVAAFAAAAAWPLAARAQKSARPVIGYLYGGSAANSSFPDVKTSHRTN